MTENNDDFQLVLPIARKNLAEFIANLLSKPQTIQGRVNGEYDLTRKNVEDFDHILKQRICQQNHADFASFSARISFNDNSAVEMNSIDEFHSFREVRQLTTDSVSLTWVYLVQFPQRMTPEKQSVEIMIRTEPRYPNRVGDISFRIEHTERTWGMDIEAMLKSHIQSIINPQSEWKRIVSDHARHIGIMAGVAFLMCAIVGSVFTTESAVDEYMKSLLLRDDSALPENDRIARRLDAIQTIVASSYPQRLLFLQGAFYSGAVVIAVLIGGWVESAAYLRGESSIQITSLDEKLAADRKKNSPPIWRDLILRIGTSVVSGSLSKYILDCLSRWCL